VTEVTLTFDNGPDVAATPLVLDVLRRRGVAECLAQEHPVLVLHDIATAGMDRLDRCLGRLGDAGARFRQEFPPAVLPMRRGLASAGLRDYVTPARRRASG